MKLLLFSILCFVTLLVIRFLQRSSGEARHRSSAEQEAGHPAASEDEIVDVHFEECQGPKKDGGVKP